jgi:phosphoglycolate phosphatase-like HAD superfamily hydrolase
VSSSPRRLVLWDIDGTLVHTAGYGRDAFAEAFETVVGRPPAEGLVPMAGRTDHDIALALLELNGIEVGEHHWPAFTEALAAALAAKEAEIAAKGRPMPGVVAVLEALAARDGVVQSLLTGNIEPNAVVKLAAFGLERHFDFDIGAFGSDHRLRPELVPIARRRAREKYGVEHEPVIVGDTPLDVAAARAGGARAVAVATGPYAVEDLDADAVLADLTNTEVAVEAILNPR